MINSYLYKQIFQQHPANNWVSYTFYNRACNALNTIEQQSVIDFLNLYELCAEDCSVCSNAGNDYLQVIVGKCDKGWICLVMSGKASWVIGVNPDSDLDLFRQHGYINTIVDSDTYHSYNDLNYLLGEFDTAIKSCANSKYAGAIPPTIGTTVSDDAKDLNYALSDSEPKGYEPDEVKEDIMDITRQMCGR